MPLILGGRRGDARTARLLSKNLVCFDVLPPWSWGHACRLKRSNVAADSEAPWRRRKSWPITNSVPDAGCGRGHGPPNP